MPMRQVEIAAKSVDEAVRLALEQLDRRSDEVDVEVLSGNEGGSEDDEVLVRVTARERISTRARAAAASAAAPRPPADLPRPAPAPVPIPLAPEPLDDEDEEEGEDEDDYQVEIEAGEQSFATPADAVAPIAAEILQKLLTQMRFRARIIRHDAENEEFLTAGSDAPSLVLNIAGISEQDKSLLIGRRGETLAALQFMVNLLLGAHTDLWARVIVDVDGYRLRRKEALTSLAERMAARVIAQRQPFPLEPMSAYDRRIVHMALADHPQVMTESTGEGEQRRVVIRGREGQGQG